MDKIISDEFLYIHMPKAEEILLSKIPMEDELSYRFSNRFNKKMRKLLKYERRTPIMRQFVHRMKVAAVLLFAILTLTFGTIVSVEAYRIRFFEFVTQVLEELTSNVTHSDNNVDHDTLILAAPSYIPKGYAILEQTSNEYKHSIIYADESGSEIYYLQKLLSQSEVVFDTENAQLKEINLGESVGYLIINKGITQLYWHDNSNVYTLISSLDEHEVIKMAKSIQNK